MSHPKTVQEIVIVGAGLAGLIQYRALQSRGFKPFLIDPRPQHALGLSNADTPLDRVDATGGGLAGPVRRLAARAWSADYGNGCRWWVEPGAAARGVLEFGQWGVGGVQP